MEEDDDDEYPLSRKEFKICTPQLKPTLSATPLRATQK
jgi:hypothetical protein